jgi:hypothetical protein
MGADRNDVTTAFLSRAMARRRDMRNACFVVVAIIAIVKSRRTLAMS